jgi:hypothetical protein
MLNVFNNIFELLLMIDLSYLKFGYTMIFVKIRPRAKPSIIIIILGRTRLNYFGPNILI